MKISLSRSLILTSLLIIGAASAVTAQKTNTAAGKKNVEQNSVSTNQKIQLSAMELGVMAELNEARGNPKKFVGYLEENKKHLKGNIIKTPNKLDVQTIEGALAIDEAIKDLNAAANLGKLNIAEGLTRVARGQLADLQEDSTLGHFGKDGSDLKTRLAKFGTASGKCGENICHRGNTARDVVMIFLVDDGVKTRSHRKAVLNPNFKQIGVACGVAKNKDNLCVIVFADSFKDKNEITTAEF